MKQTHKGEVFQEKNSEIDLNREVKEFESFLSEVSKAVEELEMMMKVRKRKTTINNPEQDDRLKTRV